MDGSARPFLGTAETRSPMRKNVIPFRIGSCAVNALDQDKMQWLRRIADKKGWPIEAVINNAMDSFVTKCEAEADLEAKIIRFPKR